MRLQPFRRRASLGTVLAFVCVCVCDSADAPAQDGGVAPAKAGSTHDLRPRFVEGRTTQYEFWGKRTTSSVTTARWGEKAVWRTMDSKGRVLWRVDQVNPDGSAACVMTLQWLTLTMTQNEGEPIAIDSREEPEEGNRIARRISAFVNKPLRCEVGADGTVNDISGVDAISAALEQIQNAGGPVKNAMFLEQASTLATIPGVQADIELDAIWQSSNKWPRDYGKIQEPMDYRVNSIEEISGIPIATVKAQADLGFEPDEEKLGDGRVDIQMNKGHAEAQIMFDLQRHEVVGRNSIETVRLTVSTDTEQLSFTSVIDEHIQSQLVRVAEGEDRDDAENE